MKKYKNALISVFDKNKLDQIAHYLIKKKIYNLFNRWFVTIFKKNSCTTY